METHDDSITLKRSKLTRSLLASTCLTVACGVGTRANTILEGSVPGSDFPNTSPGFNVMTASQVIGTIATEIDEDWFEFTGFSAGTPFTIAGRNTSNANGVIHFSIFNSSSTQIGTTANLENNPSLTRANDMRSGVVPSDGDLIVRVFPSSVAEGIGYSINLNPVPEPSTLFGAGLGMAAALAWRRRRAK